MKNLKHLNKSLKQEKWTIIERVFERSLASQEMTKSTLNRQSFEVDRNVDPSFIPYIVVCWTQFTLY